MLHLDLDTYQPQTVIPGPVTTMADAYRELEDDALALYRSKAFTVNFGNRLKFNLVVASVNILSMDRDKIDEVCERYGLTETNFGHFVAQRDNGLNFPPNTLVLARCMWEMIADRMIANMTASTADASNTADRNEYREFHEAAAIYESIVADIFAALYTN